MKIVDSQFYEVKKHNGKTETMRGDRLRNYINVMRPFINVEFDTPKPANKSKKITPELNIDLPTDLN